MIENLNTSIFKLLILTSLSHSSLFSQASMHYTNQLSLSKSVFSHLIHPVLMLQPLSEVSFDLCIFTHIQSTSIQSSQDNFFQKRAIFQFDGYLINNNNINITQCIFKYCISYHSSGCFNIQKSRSSVQYNIFSSNRGKFGGAFHSLQMKRFELNQNLFYHNAADYFGAAYIDTISTNLQSSQNNFTHNHGRKWVGALELYSSKSKTSILKYLIFDQNSAKHCAAYFDLSTPPNFKNIEIALFINNSAQRRGGAITDFPYCIQANYSKCIFIGNQCNEGNCIYVETRKAIIMLFDCFFDCSKEKAFYFNWVKQFPGCESKIICDDDVVFINYDKNKMIIKKEKEIRNKIPPVTKLEWFLNDN